MEKLILFISQAHAQVEDKSAVSDEDVKQLVNSISQIPSLGLYGIIAAIVLAIVLFAAWYWMKGIGNKTTERENQKESAKEQADTVKKDQQATDQWDEANKKSEAERLASEEGKADIPPREDQ